MSPAMPLEMINEVQLHCTSSARISNVAVAMIWSQVRSFSRQRAGLGPSITFLEDLRRHIPELQPFSGNMIRFLPLLEPESVTESTSNIADSIYAYRKNAQFSITDLEERGELSGIPCCWSALHKCVRERGGPMLIVNDLVPFDAPLRFEDAHVGMVPAEATGWRPDIPHWCPDMLDSFETFPLWQIWLTRGPHGVVVSLFSMP